MTIHQQYMQRCLELAARGAGFTAPNPMVGAVLVHGDRIIGEGWHEQYGEAHAEVNAIHQAVLNGQMDLSQTTLYVSLEPCAHFGKTPPCADFIIKNKIPKVIIGCRDPFKEVDGKGIEKLKAAGVEVSLASGEIEEECKELNKRFFTFNIKHRPYVVLKWAQTADGKMASLNPSGGGTSDPAVERLLISNEYSNRLVHKWRSEEASILIGTNTALFDDPELTTRLWPGPSPIRLVVDMDLKLPSSLKVFNRKVRTIIFNTVKQKEDENISYYQVTNDVSLVHQMMNALYQLKIQSVLVEGGAKLLQSFIDEEMWDEVRTVTSLELRVTGGLAAPGLTNAIKTEEQMLLTDKIEIYKRKHSD